MRPIERGSSAAFHDITEILAGRAAELYSDADDMRGRFGSRPLFRALIARRNMPTGADNMIMAAALT